MAADRRGRIDLSVKQPTSEKSDMTAEDDDTARCEFPPRFYPEGGSQHQLLRSTLKSNGCAMAAKRIGHGTFWYEKD